MANWLQTNCGWKINEDDGITPCLLSLSNDYYYPADRMKSDQDFRCHPDLLACVETLQEKYKNITRSELLAMDRRPKATDFQINKLEIRLEVVDYNDGYERVEISTYEV